MAQGKEDKFNWNKKKFLHGESAAAFLCLERDEESSYLGITMPAECFYIIDFFFNAIFCKN